jgi:hypothetical protein
MTELNYGSLFKMPQWVMWGIDNDDGTVTLIASRELEDWTLAMNYELEFIGPNPNLQIYYNRPNIESHGRTKKFAIINAATYGDAIRQLFDRWTNE